MTQALAHVSNPSTIMRFMSVPDGAGGYRHEMRPAAPEPAGGRKKRKTPVPDPLSASAESSAQQLAQLLDRAEGIGLEIIELQADQADVFAEAKSRGFDVATMKTILALRKKDKESRLEAEELLDTYKTALGFE